MPFTKLNRKQLTAAEAARRDLCIRFPNVIFPKGSRKKPLKIGIGADFIAAAPDIMRWRIGLALTDYCNSPSYWAACTAGAPRLDINGNHDGNVNESAAAHAYERLSELSERIRRRWTA